MITNIKIQKNIYEVNEITYIYVMKKLLLAFLVLFLSSANLVFSADECTIKKEPLELSSKLYQYWQNNMRAIDELTE
ncbi:MAG: hypothetical protein LBU14_00080 [Candidatus Peribacteria bacterium]|nr:hypothetical protein [Candidatus Peribacteria bacterium]